MNKIKVLCVVDFYLPGFKGGGPIRTLANMCEAMGSNVEFIIFTRDRDLGSDEPYPGVRTNKWLRTPSGLVYYADPSKFNARHMAKAAELHNFDVLYLNSFFGYRSSISMYFNQRLVRRKGASICIAPRGEFSAGALSIKRLKKWIYLSCARLVGLYRSVHWHASTPLEAEDIQRQFPYSRGKIHLAADPVSAAGKYSRPPDARRKTAGQLAIAFISRISPMKNLAGLIEILSRVDRKIKLSIFGPIEDSAYWQNCQALIKRLPSHITVEYRGMLEPDDVSATFAAYDLFAFPTLGENFGHVVFEALRAGTPVLVSDRTPWRAVPSGAITVVPLGSIEIWRQQIAVAADRDFQEQRSLRLAAIEFAKRYAASDQARSDTLEMFRSVAAS
ncbi:glycosyl transferase family 1 [Mesorhizobium hawassense]|uniref:Glycosyl transferase family 1 n=1 Tax=Mesorhizobium hawassense TaxID=1209954 RepID=A0A330HYF6_9HYPH|nr:glycosyltransferase [Mesorhizobium hawassense]RAZ91729.1 glycosyl transferase family 1 [Mesorhizobium hawassense]